MVAPPTCHRHTCVRGSWRVLTARMPEATTRKQRGATALGLPRPATGKNRKRRMRSLRPCGGNAPGEKRLGTSKRLQRYRHQEVHENGSGVGSARTRNTNLAITFYLGVKPIVHTNP